MKDIILKIVNAWYADLCQKQKEVSDIVDEIFAAGVIQGYSEDMFYPELSNDEEFREMLIKLFPDLVFQFANDTWFIVKEIK